MAILQTDELLHHELDFILTLLALIEQVDQHLLNQQIEILLLQLSVLNDIRDVLDVRLIDFLDEFLNDFFDLRDNFVVVALQHELHPVDRVF